MDTRSSTVNHQDSVKRFPPSKMLLAEAVIQFVVYSGVGLHVFIRLIFLFFFDRFHCSQECSLWRREWTYFVR